MAQTSLHQALRRSQCTLCVGAWVSFRNVRRLFGASCLIDGTYMVPHRCEIWLEGMKPWYIPGIGFHVLPKSATITKWLSLANFHAARHYASHDIHNLSQVLLFFRL